MNSKFLFATGVAVAFAFASSMAACSVETVSSSGTSNNTGGGSTTVTSNSGGGSWLPWRWAIGGGAGVGGGGDACSNLTECQTCNAWVGACIASGPECECTEEGTEICSGDSYAAFEAFGDCICEACAEDCAGTCGEGEDTDGCGDCQSEAAFGDCSAQLTECQGN